MKIGHISHFMSFAKKIITAYADPNRTVYQEHGMSCWMHTIRDELPNRNVQKLYRKMSKLVDKYGWRSKKLKILMPQFVVAVEKLSKRYDLELQNEHLRRIAELELPHITSRERGRYVGDMSLANAVDKILGGQPTIISMMNKLIVLMDKQSKRRKPSRKLRKKIDNLKGRLGYDSKERNNGRKNIAEIDARNIPGTNGE